MDSTGIAKLSLEAERLYLNYALSVAFETWMRSAFRIVATIWRSSDNVTARELSVAVRRAP